MRARAFTLKEVAIIVLIVGALGVLLSVTRSHIRRKSREFECVSMMRQAGVATQNYATDFKDVIASFSWRAGDEKPIEWDDMPRASSDLEAVANQMVNLIRFHGQNPDLEPIRGWLPGPKYTLNVLSDYMASPMPQPILACPEDAIRSSIWQASLTAPPPNVKAWNYTFAPPAVSTNADKRWVYSSSYEVAPASFSADQSNAGGATIAQGDTDGEHLVPRDRPFAQRLLTEVTFPEQKVEMFDSHDRHYASKPKFYADPSARQPLLFFDCSVVVRRTSETDQGFQPNNPASADATEFVYRPEGEAARWEPPGDASVRYKGWYRWTRGGLKGRDVGGAVQAEGSRLVLNALFDTAHR